MSSIAKIFFKNYNKIPPLGKNGAAANFDVAKKATVEIEMLHPEVAEGNMFMQEYAKFPTTNTSFALLQIANWFSLLFLAAHTFVCHLYFGLTGWHLWKRLDLMPNNGHHFFTAVMHAEVVAALFLLTTISQLLNLDSSRSPFRSAFCALKDLSISAISVVLLFFSTITFVRISILDWPQWLKIYVSNSFDGLSESEKFTVTSHVMSNLVITFLSLLTLLLNVMLAINLVEIMRRCGCCWKPPTSATTATFSGGTKFEQRYAQFWPFGVLKIIQWTAPISLLPMLSVSIQDADGIWHFRDANLHLLGCALIAVPFLLHWLIYQTKIHVKGDERKPNELMGWFVVDCILSVYAIVLCVQKIRGFSFGSILIPIIGIALYGTSLALNICYYLLVLIV